VRLRVITAVAALAVASAMAADSGEPARTPEELKQLQDEIAATAAQRAEDDAERKAMSAELDQLRAESTAIAAEVQKLERDLTRAEQRILELGSRDSELTGALEQRRDRIAPLLGALQRLRRDPPPALAVSPDDAVAAARGAMMIAAVAEKLETEATALAADLAELGRTRAALTAERDVAKARQAEIASRSTELAGLIERRQATVARLAEGVLGADTAIAQLEARTADMADLMAWLEENEPEEIRGAEAEPADGPVQVGGRADSFAAARGQLRWPAAGVIRAAYGETGSDGLAMRGVSLGVRIGAQVTAPFDGEIVFAGPFQGYGRLLILKPGEGYFILIGGLARLDAAEGQHVLAGEPLGTGPTSGENGTAAIYIELRRNGAPVDPAKWFEPQGANG
jgi:septal ring factor EnvC (AmiA/AmiB activator)